MKINKRIKLFFLRRRMLKSTFFDKDWYLKQYPEVQQEHIDPVRHYIERGWKEGKNPSEKFDTNKYLFSYPDIRRANKNPLKHYLRCGKKEGRICFPVGQVGILKDKKTNDCPFVSVIVASYNYENFLPETIDSILKQTYTNYEIIIVDDGSVDKSIEIIEQYVSTHKNIYLYIHPNHENKGLPATIKLGVEKARGEFVAFCESDDRWHPQYLEKKIEMVNSYEDVKIISNNIELFGDKETIEIRKPYIKNIDSFLSEGGNQIDLHYNKEVNYIPTFSSIMIRRDVLQKLDFNTPIPAWIDSWLYRQILRDAYLYYTKERLTYWRLHKSYNDIAMCRIYAKDLDLFFYKSELLNGKDWFKLHSKEIEIIRNSEYFDVDYYTAHYGNLLKDVDPAVHYWLSGWKKGYNPSARFSTDGYLTINEWLRYNDINPLLDYEQSKKKTKERKKRKIVSVDSIEDPLQGWDAAYFDKYDSAAKKVLLISHELSLTGAPRALLNMAITLKELGAIPVFLSMKAGLMEQEVKDLGIELIVDPLFCLKLKHGRLSSDCFLSVFDTIVFNTLDMAMLIEYFPVVKAKKISWLHEGSYGFGYLSQINDYSFLLPQFDEVYAVGAYCKSFAAPYVPDKRQLGILLYGIPEIEKVKSLKGHADGKLNILLPGSLEKRKGQKILLKALKYLPNEVRKQIKVYMAGAVLSKRVEKMIRRCRYSCVEYLGQLDHDKLMQLYSDMDVILTPSFDDPMPIVCTEAMILEKPIIVSENTGTASFIENGINGYKIPAGDPKALAKAIMWVVEHREDLPKLGKAARKIYDENFTMACFKENIKKQILEC